MKTLILNTIAVALFTASSGTVFAQGVTQPGQIAAASQAILSPRLAPAFSSSAVYPRSRMFMLEQKHDRKVNRIWISSMLAMAAATGMDTGSSWGKREGNSLLASSDGTFGAKGLSIKAGVAAGVILPQLLLRHHKDLKSSPFTTWVYLPQSKGDTRYLAGLSRRLRVRAILSPYAERSYTGRARRPGCSHTFFREKHER